MPARPSLTSRLAALLALYDLGGDQRAVDTEDVAMRAAQVAPKSFRWKKYPEQIDLERVRIALKDNKGHEPSMVSGGTRSGWQLTAEGLMACRQFRGSTVANGVEAKRLRQSRAFATWIESGEDSVTRNEVLELLRMNDYFPESKRRQRVAAVVNAALGDYELESFVEILKKRYPEVMRA